MLCSRMVLALPCLLAACTTPHKQPGLAEAVTTPLADLNLMRAQVPAVLVEARDRPYRLPIRSDCADLQGELHALDQALGPDLDATASSEAIQDKLGRAAGNAALKAVRRSAEDALPMRGWIRKLSGAERRDEQINAALKAGTARRAFIKGMLYAHGCITPGAPMAPATTAAVTRNLSDKAAGQVAGTVTGNVPASVPAEPSALGSSVEVEPSANSPKAVAAGARAAPADAKAAPP